MKCVNAFQQKNNNNLFNEKKKKKKFNEKTIFP